MKKLKTILQSKIFYISLIIITILYIIYINKKPIKSIYNGTEQQIIGIINNFEIDGNKLSIELLSDEKIIANYYIKTENELEYIKNNYKLGIKVLIEGTLSTPQNNTIFNSFNYKKYLQSKKIYWIFNIEKIDILSNDTNILYNIKNMFIDRIFNIKKTFNYIKTFILGDTSLIDSRVLESYQTNGISHLFSISGMHISLFSTILLFILNKLFSNKNINYIIVIFFLLFYMFLTNFTPSIIRATMLFILCTINKIFNLKIKTEYILIIICSILLFYNPYYIYNLGFVFSFTITFFLIIFSDLINKQNNYFYKLFITSLISFLASIPILINNFFSINLLSIFLNIIFVSFVSFIIFPLSLITFLFPCFESILYIFIVLLENLSLFFSKLDLFNLELCHINVYFYFFYYILIIFILICFINKKYYSIFLLIIVMMIHYNNLYFNKYPVITIIDVGQGDSILITLPHNKGNILIDTGGIVSYNENWQQRKDIYSIAIDKIIPYLKSIGVKKLDYLILSHGDYDHMGEAINLVNNFKVEKVIFNCGEFNELEKELIKVLEKKKIKYYSCIKELNIDNNKLYFLQTKGYENENDDSNVIYTELNGYKYMFMGDAGVEKEKDILSTYNISDIDILKVGHHGSKTSSSKDFINEINPKYSIISVGKNNRYGHPNKEVINNLEDSKIYRTDEDGSIMFKIKNNKLKIETCSP